MEEKPIIFLNKKREITHDADTTKQPHQGTINLHKLIDEAFNNFLNGENDKFLSNYQILENNVNSNNNIIIS